MKKQETAWEKFKRGAPLEEFTDEDRKKHLVIVPDEHDGEPNYFWREDDGERWTIILKKSDKGPPEPSRIVYSDFYEFTGDLPQEERDRLARKYTVPQFKIFMEGYRYAFDNLQPRLVKAIKESSKHYEPRNQNANKEFRKPTPQERLIEVLGNTPFRGGRPNLSAMAKKLDLKDGQSVKDRLKEATLWNYDWDNRKS